MIETHAGCDSVRRETVTRGGRGVVKERVKVFDGIMEELQDFKRFDWNWILL